MKKLLFIGLLPLIAACEPIKGTMEVYKTLEYTETREVKDEYCFSPDEWECDNYTERVTVSLTPGSFSTKLNFNSKESMSLEIKKSKKETTRIEMDIPKGVNVPRVSGSFELSASQIDKKFDVAGEVDTEYSRSDIYSGTESCTYTERERVCERIIPDDCDGRGRGKKGRRGRGEEGRGCHPIRKCEDKYVTRYGRQDVEYHYEYETTNVKMDLLTPNTPEKIAYFSGSRTESDKVYDYKSRCF